MPIFQLRPKDRFFELPQRQVPPTDMTWKRFAPLFIWNREHCEAIEYPPGYRGNIVHKRWQEVAPFLQFLLRVDASGENADFVDIDGRVANAALDPQADASFLNAVPLGTSGDKNNFAVMGAAVDEHYLVAGVLLCMEADDARATRNLFPTVEPQ